MLKEKKVKIVLHFCSLHSYQNQCVCKCNLSHKSLGHKPAQCQCVVTILLN